jgi:hypothetical protein
MHYIASATSTGTTGVFTFNNIPQTFTHLQIRWSARSLASTTNGEQLAYFFNNDRSSIYTCHSIYGDGATATSNMELQNQTYATLRGTSMPNAGSTANVFASSILDILDYTNTNKNKTVRALFGWDLNGSGQLGISSALFRTLDSISRIDLTVSSGSNYTSGSRADLYGINSNPTATGV